MVFTAYSGIRIQKILRKSTLRHFYTIHKKRRKGVNLLLWRTQLFDVPNPSPFRNKLDPVSRVTGIPG